MNLYRKYVNINTVCTYILTLYVLTYTACTYTSTHLPYGSV